MRHYIYILLYLFYTVIPLNFIIMLFALLCYSDAFKNYTFLIHLLCHLKFPLLYMCSTIALCTLEQQMTEVRQRKWEVKRSSGKVEREGLTPATPVTASVCAATSPPSFLWNLISWCNCSMWKKSHWPRIPCTHRVYCDSHLNRK